MGSHWIQWIQSENVANRATMYRTAPTTKNVPAPNVKSAKMKKPHFRRRCEGEAAVAVKQMWR